MKKMSAREFQHSFSHAAQALRPGQGVLVTKHGKPLGTFIKAPERKVRTYCCPDFVAELRQGDFDKSMGQEVIDGICAAVLSGSGVAPVPPPGRDPH